MRDTQIDHANQMYEMGWNDALGGILIREPRGREVQMKFAETIERQAADRKAGPTPTTYDNPHYNTGVADAIDAFVGNRNPDFKGDKYIVDMMRATVKAMMQDA